LKVVVLFEGSSFVERPAFNESLDKWLLDDAYLNELKSVTVNQSRLIDV
jgi:hypothetical protein